MTTLSEKETRSRVRALVAAKRREVQDRNRRAAKRVTKADLFAEIDRLQDLLQDCLPYITSTTIRAMLEAKSRLADRNESRNSSDGHATVETGDAG